MHVAVHGEQERRGRQRPRRDGERGGEPGALGQKRCGGVQVGGEVQRAGLQRLRFRFFQDGPLPVLAHLGQLLGVRLGPGRGAGSRADRLGRQLADTSDGEPRERRRLGPAGLGRRGTRRADRLQVSPQAHQGPGGAPLGLVDWLAQRQGQREAGERPVRGAARGRGRFPLPAGLAQVVVAVGQAPVERAPDGVLVTAVALDLVVAQIERGL